MFWVCSIAMVFCIATNNIGSVSFRKVYLMEGRFSATRMMGEVYV